MKSASLLYPYDATLKLLKVILKREGCIIVSENIDQGTIKAQVKGSLLHKPKALDIKIEMRDKNITNVNWMINSNARVYDYPMTDDESMEEELLRLINHYF